MSGDDLTDERLVWVLANYPAGTDGHVLAREVYRRREEERQAEDYVGKLHAAYRDMMRYEYNERAR